MTNDDYVKVGLGVLPFLGALGGVWAGKALERRNSDRAEQKKLALDLLLRIERYCDTIHSRRTGMFSPPTVPPYNEDPLVTKRNRIVVHAQGIKDPVAFAHLMTLDIVLWWIRDTSGREPAIYVEPYPIKETFRAVLGAIMRGERVPSKLPANYLALLASAKEADAYCSPDDDEVAAPAGMLDRVKAWLRGQLLRWAS